MGAGAPLPAPVYGPASTSAGAYIYSASGGTFPVGGTSTLFQRYNPASNVWDPLPPVPTAVFGATLVYYPGGGASGQLFLFGGFASTPVPINAVHVYDIATNTWDPPPNGAPPPLPAPRANMGSGVIGNSIYLVGGHATSPSSAASQTWAFNPVSWTYDTTLANLPIPQARAGSAVAGGRLYVISGHTDGGGLVTHNHEYNPSTNTWASKTPIPVAVNQPGSLTVGAMTPECNGKIMIVSGGTPTAANGAHSDPSRAPESIPITQLYDVATNTWALGPPLPTGRLALRAEQVADTILAFGGYDGTNTVATVDRMKGPPLPVQLQAFSIE